MLKSHDGIERPDQFRFFNSITLAFIIYEIRYCKNFLLFQTVEPCAEFDKVQERERDKDENRKVIRIGGN